MIVTIAVLSALGALFLLCGVVISNNFGAVSITQITFHLLSGMEIGGVRQTQEFIHQLIAVAILPSILLGFSVFLLLRGVGFRAYIMRLSAIGVSILLIGSISFMDTKTGLTSYAKSLTSDAESPGRESILDKFYAEPKLSAPNVKRNLIFVYLESIEAGFADKEVYGQNLIANLDEVTSGPGWLDIPTMEGSLPGTGWTIAALVSTQCGLPLVVTGVGGGNSSLEGDSSFLKNAICLGDILSSAGYTNVFMGGADLNFAGKGNFLATHGFSETLGRSDWIAKGHRESEMHAWGLRDEDLLLHATDKLDLLVRSNEPFALFLLTVDSHAPSGLPDPRCESERSDALERSIQCSTDSVARFLDTVGSIQDTTIVVLGDHPLMATTISEKLNGQSENRVLFRLRPAMNKGLPGYKVSSPFDVFPTVLDSLGFKSDGKMVGLGVSALSNEKSPLQELSRDTLESGLQVRSQRFWDFW